MVREGWGLDALQSPSNYVKAFVSSLPLSVWRLCWHSQQTDAGLPVSSPEIPAWTWMVSKNVKHHKTRRSEKQAHTHFAVCVAMFHVCHTASAHAILHECMRHTASAVSAADVPFPASPPLVCHIDYLSFSSRDWLSWRPWSLRCLCVCDPKRCSCFSDVYEIFQ